MSTMFPGQFGDPGFELGTGFTPPNEVNNPNANWVNNDFPGQTPRTQLGGGAPPVGQPPATQNQNNPRNPMDYFRTDIGGANPLQHASAAGQTYLQGLMPGIQFGQTRVGGPNAPSPQSIFNVGGQGANYNTGLNIANQLNYGSGDPSRQSLLERMIADERRLNAGSRMAGNDASVEGYTGYSGDPYTAGQGAGYTPPPNTFNPANYQSPATQQAAAQAANAQANQGLQNPPAVTPPPNNNNQQGQTGGPSQGTQSNFLQQLLPLLLLGGLGGSGGLQQLLMLSMLGGGGLQGLTGGQNTSTNTNRNPFLYGLTY